jgi:hypothetical protein
MYWVPGATAGKCPRWHYYTILCLGTKAITFQGMP